MTSMIFYLRLISTGMAAIITGAGMMTSSAEGVEKQANVPSVIAHHRVASASGVTLPGEAPGTAKVTLEPAGITIFENDVLRLEIHLGKNGPVPVNLLNKLSDTSRKFEPLDAFLLTLADGTEISARDLTLTKAPEIIDLAVSSKNGKLSSKFPGKAVSAFYEYSGKSGSFTLEWSAELRDDSNYVIQRYAIQPKSEKILFDRAQFMDVRLTDVRHASGDQGNPVIAGKSGSEDIFFGLETPLSTITPVTGGYTLAVPSKLGIDSGSKYEQTTAIGVSQPGQLRRSFNYYLERERAFPRRTFLHYQSWYDNRVAGDLMQSSLLNNSMKIFGAELFARKVKIDGFFIDAGWDYRRKPQVKDESKLTVWSFNPTEFPDGFGPQKEIAKRYNAAMAVWMSPFGGYEEALQLRTDLNASKPENERFRTSSNGKFTLSDPKYYAHFKSVAFDMIQNQGVKAFKFDGVGSGLFQTGANAQFLVDYESLLNLMRDLRQDKPDVWINATVGTWASPYWLWYVDSIWRDDGDYGTLGDGSPAQQNVTFRDFESIENRQKKSVVFPMANLMNHGFMFSDSINGAYEQNTDLTNEEVKRDISTTAKAFFGLGLGLQELYLKPTLASQDKPGSKYFWDILAMNANWARQNEQILTDSRMVGGDPSTGAIYGNAAWHDENGGSGVVMLRNPSNSTKTIAIDPAELFQLPVGLNRHYSFTERDNEFATFTADSESPKTIELKPLQVLIFSAQSVKKAAN